MLKKFEGSLGVASWHTWTVSAQAKAVPAGSPALRPSQGPIGDPSIHADLLKPRKGREQALQPLLPASRPSLVCLRCGVSGESHQDRTITLRLPDRPAEDTHSASSGGLTATRQSVPEAAAAEKPGLNTPNVLSSKNSLSQTKDTEGIYLQLQNTFTND